MSSTSALTMVAMALAGALLLASAELYLNKRPAMLVALVYGCVIGVTMFMRAQIDMKSRSGR